MQQLDTILLQMADEELQSLAASNARLREENIRLRAKVNAFETSRSWRVTAPLRASAAFLRRYRITTRFSQMFLGQQLNTYEWNNNNAETESDAAQIAVIAHIYYADLAEEIATTITRCGPHVRVVITYVDAAALPIIALAFEKHQFAEVKYLLVENLGRDFWPFIQALQTEPLTDVDAILKLHTKKSPHLAIGDGDNWRRSLLSGLAPNSTAVLNLALEFKNNPSIAWACPREWIAGNESCGRNRITVQRLFNRCGLKMRRTLIFPAGSMFWMGSELRQCLIDLNLTREDFHSVPTLDGSTEHALERFVGSWAIAQRKVMYRTRLQAQLGTTDS